MSPGFPPQLVSPGVTQNRVLPVSRHSTPVPTNGSSSLFLQSAILLKPTVSHPSPSNLLPTSLHLPACHPYTLASSSWSLCSPTSLSHQAGRGESCLRTYGIPIVWPNATPHPSNPHCRHHHHYHQQEGQLRFCDGNGWVQREGYIQVPGTEFWGQTRMGGRVSGSARGGMWHMGAAYLFCCSIWASSRH